MKKYNDYIKYINENEDLPTKEELEALYPNLEYPGQRMVQWNQDNIARAAKEKASMDYERNQIAPIIDDQKDQITTKITHMIARAFAMNNDEFLDEMIDVIESYPELLVGLRIKGEIAHNDRAIDDSTGF